MCSLSRLRRGFSEAKSPLLLRHVQLTAATSLLFALLTFFKLFAESPGQSSQQLLPSLPSRSALLSCLEMMCNLCKHSSKVYLTRLCVAPFVEGPVFLLWRASTFASPCCQGKAEACFYESLALGRSSKAQVLVWLA